MIGVKKVIHFLSASDRINYGDLLFPIIAKEIFQKESKDIEFINYSTIKSDNTDFDALPTKSYREFQKNVKKRGGNVLIGGGEVLFVDWGSLLAFISFFYSRLLSNEIYNRIERKFNFTSFLLSDGSVFVPFAPNKKELRSNRQVKIFYNAVGGTYKNSRITGKKSHFTASLYSAHFISVRDERVKQSLLDHGIESRLSPDSALIMSDIFPLEVIKKKTRIKSFYELPSKYIFLQLGRNYGPKNQLKFADDVLKISKQLNYSIVLCPIGLAPRHEDDAILKDLHDLLGKSFLINPQSLFDIMFLIANSKLYLGTSLHGLITAQSFDVPFVPLNPKLHKVEEYCKTWTKSNIEKCLEFENLHEAISIYKNWNYSDALKEKNRQKLLVYENFNRILYETV